MAVANTIANYDSRKIQVLYYWPPCMKKLIHW